MLSLWPWRSDTSSTASFEKTLSILSAKISRSQASLDKLRGRSRRAKVLATLYLTFAYLVYAIVILLVVGYNKMGPYEGTGLAAGPVLIYGTRTSLSTYYNFRIDALSSRLKLQVEERAKTIQKLKDATKYDSTMELIQKYGGANKLDDSNKPASSAQDEKKGKSSPKSQQRTAMPPPPTANIQRRPEFPSAPSALEPTAEFAPNAGPEYPHKYSKPVQIAPQASSVNLQQSSHWYDRIFDVLLGEDETAPKNRIVLLCCSCRLVNGQAPPGVKALHEIGKWRCMGCGAHNGGECDDQNISPQTLHKQIAGRTTQEVFKSDSGEDGTSSENDLRAGTTKIVKDSKAKGNK